MFRDIIIKFIFLIPILTSCLKEQIDELSVLYWNLQNGMWSDQENNYDNFVAYVKSIDPDICVWIEAETIYQNEGDLVASSDERYLIDGWDNLAKRYGHDYWCVSGHNDNYPQVITSKYPIEVVKKITGSWPDNIVVHGSCWSRIMLNRRAINIVPVHLWPHDYSFSTEMDFDYMKSKDNKDGDRYRLMEMEYICRETINNYKDISDDAWIFVGDFNALSPVDNDRYSLDDDDSEFLVHQYLRKESDLYDLISEFHPGVFYKTYVNGTRIDYIYASKWVLDHMVDVRIISDEYTTPKAKKRFYTPSDHYPIFLNLRLNH